MLLVLDHPPVSSQPLMYNGYSYANEICVGYTNEPQFAFDPLPDEELTAMAMTVAQVSLAEGWNLDDEEEDAYWQTFLTHEKG